MPATAVSTVSPLHDVRADEEELSDGEIQRLLKEAEVRLKAAEESKSSVTNGVVATQGQVADTRRPLPKLQSPLKHQPYVRSETGIARADPTLLIDKEQRKLADNTRSLEKKNESKKTNDRVSAGPQWFDLPKTIPTDQLKRDFQMIEMRNVLDPHRHYKKDNRKGKLPAFSQTGTVIEGPTEWYSSRIQKRDRVKSFVAEAMATEHATGRFKRKYDEIQETKTSGKKAHYKKVLAKRKKKP